MKLAAYIGLFLLNQDTGLMLCHMPYGGLHLLGIIALVQCNLSMGDIINHQMLLYKMHSVKIGLFLGIYQV